MFYCMFYCTCDRSYTVEGRVKAVDDGARTDSSQVVYSLRSSTSGEFELNRITGDLRTRRPLDREVVQSSAIFVLVVCVHFNDAPNLMDCTNVTINVLDVNDNRPIVHQVRAALDDVVLETDYLSK